MARSGTGRKGASEGAGADPAGFDTGKLLPGEQALLAALANPSMAAAEGIEVRGDFLGALLSGDGAPWRGPLPERLHFSGMTVSAALRLTGLKPGCRLHFDRCMLQGPLSCDGARLESLEFAGCRLAAASFRGADVRRLRMERVEVGGHLSMDDLAAGSLSLVDSRVRGMLSLVSARIERDLLLNGSRIGTGKKAIQADHIIVGRTIHLGAGKKDGQACLADGAVSLVASRFEALLIEGEIEGALDLRRSISEAVLVRGGSSLGAVLLDRAGFGDFEIEDGARLGGALEASNINVGGDFRMGGRHECPGAEAAVDLAGARIAGDLRFGDAFSANAPIRMQSCSVGGNLAFKGRVAVDGGNGLDLRDVRCGRLEIGFADFAGGISARHGECLGLVLSGAYRCPADYPLHLGLACSGRVAIGSAGAVTEIVGTLSLIGLRCHELILRRLSVAAPAEGRWRGVAVAARHLEVTTLTRFGQFDDGAAGLALDGHAAFDHAAFGDDVRFCGVRIAAPPFSAITPDGEPAPALTMRKAGVRGNVDFGADAEGGALAVTGPILLDGLSVDGDLDLSSLCLDAGAAEGTSFLSLSTSSIGGVLRAAGLELIGSWSLDLSHASAARVEDRHGLDWPPAALEITTFRYADVEDLAVPASAVYRDGVDARLAWIARHQAGRFSPQPYRTLVAALRASGHPDEVARVEMAARVRRRRTGSAPILVKAGNAVLEWTSGYGYSPVRALATLILLFIVGWGGTSLAAWQGAFEASLFMDSNLLAASAGNALPGTCPWLDPPLYALDLIMPIVALGHENLCSLRPGWSFWQWAATVYRLIGWVVVSIVLLTFSGILRKEV